MPKTPRVREPVQVYLDSDDRDTLDAVAAAAGISRAEALRRGLRRLAAETLGRQDPAHAFVAEMAGSAWPARTPTDLAARHDHYLTQPAEPTPPRRKRRTG
jgi:hypothetical protein